MIKKFILKLANWQAQRRDPKDFHQADIIGSEKAKEHSREAIGKRHELSDQMEKREEPADSVILGPSDSEEA